jgi:hypothetical protein
MSMRSTASVPTGVGRVAPARHAEHPHQLDNPATVRAEEQAVNDKLGVVIDAFMKTRSATLLIESGRDGSNLIKHMMYIVELTDRIMGVDPTAKLEKLADLGEHMFDFETRLKKGALTLQERDVYDQAEREMQALDAATTTTGALTGDDVFAIPLANIVASMLLGGSVTGAATKMIPTIFSTTRWSIKRVNKLSVIVPVVILALGIYITHHYGPAFALWNDRGDAPGTRDWYRQVAVGAMQHMQDFNTQWVGHELHQSPHDAANVRGAYSRMNPSAITQDTFDIATTFLEARGRGEFPGKPLKVTPYSGPDMLARSNARMQFYLTNRDSWSQTQAWLIPAVLPALTVMLVAAMHVLLLSPVPPKPTDPDIEEARKFVEEEIRDDASQTSIKYNTLDGRMGPMEALNQNAWTRTAKKHFEDEIRKSWTVVERIYHEYRAGVWDYAKEAFKIVEDKLELDSKMRHLTFELDEWNYRMGVHDLPPAGADDGLGGGGRGQPRRRRSRSPARVVRRVGAPIGVDALIDAHLAAYVPTAGGLAREAESIERSKEASRKRAEEQEELERAEEEEQDELEQAEAEAANPQGSEAVRLWEAEVERARALREARAKRIKKKTRDALDDQGLDPSTLVPTAGRSKEEVEEEEEGERAREARGDRPAKSPPKKRSSKSPPRRFGAPVGVDVDELCAAKLTQLGL